MGVPSEQQAVSAVESKQTLPSGARRRLDSLSFIQDHVLPSDLLEVLRVLNNQLIRCDENVKRRILSVGDMLAIPELAQDLTILCIAPVRKDLQGRDELGDPPAANCAV